MQLADLVIVDAVEHVCEPFLGVTDAVVFAGGEEGIEHRRALGCFVAAGNSNFAPDSRRADNVLHQVVVDLNIAVTKTIMAFFQRLRRIG